MLKYCVFGCLLILSTKSDTSNFQNCEDKYFSIDGSYRYEKYCKNVSLDILSEYFNNDQVGLTITNSYFPVLGLRSGYHLPNVWFIQLINNSIHKIKLNCFQENDRLENLSLALNSISNIDGLFDKLPNLRTLNLSSNSIGAVNNRSFEGPASSLIVLDLSRNNIKFLAISTFHSLKILKELYLNENLLKEFNVECFDVLNLFIFNISSNRLEYFNTTILTMKSKVQHLYMSNVSSLNKNLQKFPEMFTENEFITLDISSNQISTLDFNVFKNMVKIQKIYLQNNLLGSVDFDAKTWINIVAVMTQLEKIDLNNNVWNCIDLKELIYIISITNASIIRGNHNEGNNLLGISCVELDQDALQIKDSKLKDIFKQLNAKIRKMNETVIEMNDNINKTLNQDVNNKQLTNIYNKELKDILSELNKTIVNQSVHRELLTKDSVPFVNKQDVSELKYVLEKLDYMTNVFQNTQSKNAEKLTSTKTENVNNKFSAILTNVLLFSIVCFLVYFAVLQYRAKRFTHVGEAINLA